MNRLGVGRSSIWKPLAVVLAMGALLLAPVAAISLNDAHTLNVTGPLTVWGYVYDFSGQPLEGANVVVTVVESGATSSGVTGSDGKYQASPEFTANSEYDIGNTIQVVASYNSNVQANTSTVPVDIDDIGGLMQVDVHYTYEVPEFGAILGFIVAGVLVGMIAIFAVSKRRSRSE
jgi:hypothetical protein